MLQRHSIQDDSMENSLPLGSIRSNRFEPIENPVNRSSKRGKQKKNNAATRKPSKKNTVRAEEKAERGNSSQASTMTLIHAMETTTDGLPRSTKKS